MAAYFGKNQEAAIKEYLRVPDERLFNEVISPALNKLAENVIHNKKFYNYGPDEYVNAKHDCVVHMFHNLHKFDPDKGYKAFSYFNRVAINWVWANMRTAINFNKIEKVEKIDLQRNIVNEVSQAEYLTDLSEFCFKWSQWGIDNCQYFYFQKDDKILHFTLRDRKIANAIFNLFQHCHQIDIYNKKALYIMVREQVNVKTQNITDVLHVLKPMFSEMYKDYLKNGTKYWHRFLYYPEEYEPEITETFCN